MSISAELNQDPIGAHYAQRLFLVFLGLAALSLLVLLAERMAGSRIALGGHSDSTARYEIVIDNDVLSVSENMIRLPEQRRGGIADRLDLYLSWPELNGYSHSQRNVFNGLDKNKALIFLSFEERTMSRDMTGRFEPIYKFLIDGKGDKTPTGLTRFSLPAKAGYLNEALYVDTGNTENRVIARCSEDKKESLIAACERDVQVGANLSATIRFPARLLSEWRQLDAALTEFMGRTIATTVNE